MRTPRFWEGPPGRASLASMLLMPAAWAITSLHRARWHYANPRHAAIPIICVGNVVTGGAGKTPVALAVAEFARNRGFAPHFLTRGYRGQLRGPLRVNPARHTPKDVGDEALLLAAAAHTWVARDRVAGARAAAEGGAEVLILDDGFQNPNIVKDVSLLLIDQGYGIGNGRVLPAGPLRESPAGAVARADAVVHIRHAGSEPGTLGALIDPGISTLTARLEPDSEDSEHLSGKRVLGFAGIARPQKFFDTLNAIGCTVVDFHTFPDHHAYRESDLAKLIHNADAMKARLVTTEKDAVKLPAAVRAQVAVLKVTAVFEDELTLANVLAPALR